MDLIQTIFEVGSVPVSYSIFEQSVISQVQLFISVLKGGVANFEVGLRI